TLFRERVTDCYLSVFDGRNHSGLTSNAQRRTSNAQCRFLVQHSMSNVERLLSIAPPPSSSTRVSPALPLISLHRVPAIRGPPCAHRSVCSPERSRRALPRSCVPARASARASRSRLPKPPLRRACLSIRERFAPPFSFRGR